MCLSDDLPVPQCCRRRFARLAAPAADECSLLCTRPAALSPSSEGVNLDLTEHIPIYAATTQARRLAPSVAAVVVAADAPHTVRYLAHVVRTIITE